MDITFIGYVIYGCVLFLLILFAVCTVFFTHAVYTDHKQNKKISTVTPDSQITKLQNKIQELSYSVNGIHTRLSLESENQLQIINTLLHYNNELQTITLTELNRTTTKTTARRRYHKLR